MQLEGAVIREQGVTFAIVVVKRHVLSSPAARADMVSFAQQVFGLIPVVLMAQDTSGTPRYFGRRDIVKFLGGIHPSRIPWRRYSVAA